MLSATVGAQCELIAQELRGAVSTAGEQVAQLRFVNTAFAVDVVAEGALVADLVSRLVGRPFRVPPVTSLAPGAPGTPTDREPEPDATLRGAFAALAVDLARRCNGGAEPEPVRLRGSRLGPGFVAEQTFTVLVDGRPYSAALRFTAPESAPKAKGANLDSVDKGLWVNLSLVASLAWLPRVELSTLRVGDVWSAGTNPDLDVAADGGVLRGRCALASPCGTMGLAATFEGVDTLVVGSSLIALPLDVDVDPHDAGDVDGNVDAYLGEEPPVAEEKSKTPGLPGLDDALLSAPIVVRVELGSVGMTVREWSELRAGDVIQSGRRVGAAADLRVGGAVVARGELVSVEGELGVRIVEIVPPGS